ncbi:uncharacterized protein [Diabrotica undecimpunctata]|uniref:uncharacterized protein n=1 Tax=Diabrotica undecimpunctata TaxID=50387 RepID=UPI003B63DB0D
MSENIVNLPLELEENDPYSDSGSEYEPNNGNNSSDSNVSNLPADDLRAENIVIENEGGVMVESLTKGRKRKRNPTEWTRTVNAVRRYSGKAYVNRNRKNIPGKSFKNVDCKCRRLCFSNITLEERQLIFDSFYKLADNTKQNIYLRGLIHNSSCQNRRVRNGSRAQRLKSVKYYLTTTDLSIRVCKKFFKDTFQVSEGRIYKLSCSTRPASCIDKRGHKEPTNKIDVTKVKEHIKSFPCYKSHYTLCDAPDRKYLNPDLNIRKMYQLYKEKCEQEGSESVKEKMYYHVFSSNFNLHFKPPSKDTCQLCDSLYNTIRCGNNDEDIHKAKTNKEIHLRKAKLARDSLNKDKNLADENIYVLTFDLQKALPFPKLSTSVAYYKMNLYVYNLGIHSFNENKGYMFMWDETEGSRGSQEVASCLTKHLKMNARNCDNIILYSDCCTGQNRNIKLSLSLLKLVQDPEMKATSIDHKFLTSGHSYLPNDADFGVIETKAKKKEFIYGPEDWINLVATAKKTNSFQIIEMKREEFLSTRMLENSIINRKIDTTGGKVNWLNIKWLKYYKNKPESIFYKETLQEDFPFNEINIAKKSGKGRPPKFFNIVQEQL